MNTAITYTLPAIQLVCHLVVSGNSSINNTDSGAIQPTLTTPVPVPRLPAGYVIYPDFGAAYKVHNDLVSWEVANEKCIQEGAYLATIDSVAKIQAVFKQGLPHGYGHTGFYLIENDHKWYNIHTGLSVPESSLPWQSGEPTGDGHCVLIHGQNGLGSYHCDSRATANPVCQITYP